MTQLDENTIKELIQLCRIGCTEEEQIALLADLKSILDYVNLLQEVETEDIPPCNHVIDGMANVMREDIVGEIMPREVFLANAPSHIGGMIKVPPVLKSNE